MKTKLNGAKTEKTTEKRNLPQTFKPGNPGGPGRPKGSRSIEALFDEAITMLVAKGKKEGIGIIDLEAEILMTMLSKARAGNPKMIELWLDRRFGKVKQPVEVETNTPQTVVNIINEIGTAQSEWFEDEKEESETEEILPNIEQKQEEIEPTLTIEDDIFESEEGDESIADLLKNGYGTAQ